ncbi:MAG: Na-K-Cl cotransporter [Planctomycetota bacterium]|nr:MAG: Na-K-Cl cotransporter [Planctomycetota bacterium]
MSDSAPAATKSAPANGSPAEAQSGTLGTFAGVFTPSVLTILGLILFLRTGYVIGAAGLASALLIILIANVISLLTSTSLSAIATNLRVRGGGDYYLISRTLGVEFGGALGLVLFLAQSVSVAFYAIGFGEAIAALGNFEPWVGQLFAGGAVTGLFVLAWLGADVATRFQYVVMVTLFSAITAFFVGGFSAFDGELLSSNWGGTGGVSFWVLFAIFFPAVTGFTQGVSMSGDLAEPGKSLPRGTFLAVFVSMAIYLVTAILFAGSMPGAELVADYNAMRKVSSVGWLVDAGVIAATLSSALASFLGAPRILQSLASDRVFSWLTPFAKVDPASGNPRRGVLLAAAIAYATILVGDLNAIAPLVSMFFLISYGLLNFATWYESRGRSPSFRPRFRWFDERLSLLGALGCLGAMIAVDPTWGAVSLVVLVALHQLVARNTDIPRWADGSRSFRFQRIRENLHAVTNNTQHARDWRPVLLAFSDDPKRRRRLLRFASWIEGNSGFTTAVRLVEGKGIATRKKARELQAELNRELVSNGVEAFGRVIAVEDVEHGLPVLLQSHGIGGIEPNMVLLNWFDGTPLPEGSFGMRRYGRPLRTALRHGCHVVVLEATTEEMAHFFRTKPNKRRIDVWYSDDASGHLLLMLAYLMTRTDDWEEATLRVLIERGERESDAEALEGLQRKLDDVRIRAKPQVVAKLDHDLVVRHSADATVVLMPFVLRDECPTTSFDCSLDELVEDLPITGFVAAAEDIDLEAAPESGSMGVIANALDTVQDAETKLRQADTAAEQALEAASTLREKLLAAQAADGPAEQSDALAAELADADADAEDKRRRALKAQAKLESATREADAVKRGETPSSSGENAPPNTNVPASDDTP